MALPAFTLADLTEVRLAISQMIAGGVSSVTVGGQTVTGLTLKDLYQREAMILAELSMSEAQPVRTQKIMPYYP